MTNIPKQAIEPSERVDKLSQVAQELPLETEAPEAIPYVISFAKYKNKFCEIITLTRSQGNKALFFLKEIGIKVFSRVDFQKNDIKTRGVANSGEYKKLYNGLDISIEVRELFLPGTARIFYFEIEPERILYIIAIRQNHFEMGKVRR